MTCSSFFHNVLGLDLTKTHQTQEYSLKTMLEQAGFNTAIHPLMTKNKKTNQCAIRNWKLTGMPIDGTLDLNMIMPPGSFIYQPLGTHEFPDFLVRDFDGRYFTLESKKSDDGKPVWNDNCPLPCSHAVYVYSSGAQTTAFLGSDYVNQTDYKVIQVDYSKTAKDACRFIVNQIADEFSRGLTVGHRIKVDQQGTSDFTNPLKHKHRRKCENNVLRFAKNEPYINVKDQ